MPVILRIRGYRFWFYEADLAEPPHVHAGKEDREAKYWMDPIALARPGRFREHELSEIEKILATCVPVKAEVKRTGAKESRGKTSAR